MRGKKICFGVLLSAFLANFIFNAIYSELYGFDLNLSENCIYSRMGNGVYECRFVRDCDFCMNHNYEIREFSASDNENNYEKMSNFGSNPVIIRNASIMTHNVSHFDFEFFAGMFYIDFIKSLVAIILGLLYNLSRLIYRYV